MAQIGDVARRLDQGEPAVTTFAEFVWACAQLGYHHPDLTAHAGQVHDWYAAEDGLDLRMLDADCTALAATADSAEHALRLQNDQLGALERAWQGHGASAARDLLDRHRDAARQAAAAVRRAADTLAPLRDQLWRAIDTKVAVTERIEARCAAQRPAWLAAARAVRTGLGNRDAASELIDTQVKPFVDNDIGADWVPAMRSATAAVADAYAAALAALADGPAAVFEIPGDLGPSWTPSGDRPGPVLASAADAAERPPVVGASGGFTAAPASVPSFSAPAVMVPAGMAPGAPAVGPEPIAPEAAPVGSAPPGLASPAGSGQGLGGGGLPGMGGLPGLGGMPDIGSGLAGSGQQLADLLGGLVGSSADDLPQNLGDLKDDHSEDLDPETDDGPRDDMADDAEHDTDDGSEGGGTEGAEEDAEMSDGEAAEPGETGEVTELQSDSPEPASEVPAPVSPPTAPDPVAEPLGAPAGETPCEIAADELPHAGP